MTSTITHRTHHIEVFLYRPATESGFAEPCARFVSPDAYPYPDGPGIGLPSAEMNAAVAPLGLFGISRGPEFLSDSPTGRVMLCRYFSLDSPAVRAAFRAAVWTKEPVED